MDRQVTLNHLARHLGVHPTTISMALRGSSEISEATRKRIQDLAQRWHYTPNHVARSLRRRSTRTLGLVFPYATLPYYATLLDALDAEAETRGLHLEVRFHQWSTQYEANSLHALVERRVDGIILLPAASTTLSTLGDCLPPPIDLPVALVGSFGGRSLPRVVRGCVSTDMRSGSESLGRHLLEMGHRRIAILLPHPTTGKTQIDQRLDGLRAAIGQGDVATLQQVFLADEAPSPEWYQNRALEGASARSNFILNQQLAERFLQLSPRPTAVVATDEPMAHVLLACLRRHGIRVPEDVSLACYDGTFLSEFGAVPLTCVQQPIPDMARHLMELVLREQPRKGPAEARILQPTLVQRDSVGRVSGGSSSNLEAGSAFKTKPGSQVITGGKKQ